jgi:hypothetical protein
MIYRSLKCQGEIFPLDYQCTLKNERQEGKIGPSQGWGPVGGEWA